MDSHSEYSKQFQNLNEILLNQQTLWKPQPFYQLASPWQQLHPQMHEALLGLSDEKLDRLTHDDHSRINWFRGYLGADYTELFRYKPKLILAQSTLKISPFQTKAIPGRKLAQILAFNHALPHSSNSIIEWCAGKGHLGRTINLTKAQIIHCLELDSSLCDSGKQLAAKHKANMTFHHHDVLEALPKELQGESFDHIGLHACGKLHMQLLITACQQKAKHIAISPCCYHKIEQEQYAALSQEAAASDLVLSCQDLHLPQEQTITGGHRVEMLRNKEQLWRLAFDCLYQQLSGKTAYTHMPSINKAIFSSSFTNFCLWAAKQRGLNLAAIVNESQYLAKAECRLKQIRRLELIRQLFQRPLELWLALDRVLFLYEQGYQAQLSEFCASDISPRNLMISASR